LELTKTKYKQTEIGLIPEDWTLIGLGDIFSFYSTANYSKAQMSEDDEVGCIHYGLIHAISNSHFNLKDGIKYYVKPEMAKYEYVLDGDVIMVDASEDLEGINKSVEVFGIGNKKFISGLHTYLLRDKESILAERFKGILLNSKLVKDQMLSLAVGMKVFGVSKTQLIKIKLPIPPTLTEQKAIATALSDVDSLISSLDKLITKKKAIKQGAMQELLTPPHKGGRRLPGFSGEWEIRRLGEVAKINMGQSPLSSNYNNQGIGLPLIQGNADVKKRKTIIRNFTSQITKIAYANDIIMSVRAPVGEISRAGFDCCIGRGVCSIQYGNEYLYHYLVFLENSWSQFSTGSTFDSVNSNQVKLISIPLPPTLSEQKSIAQIFTDMDLEIESLENKKAKYQEIKQGMMQELLTGKTRLI